MKRKKETKDSEVEGQSALVALHHLRIVWGYLFFILLLHLLALCFISLPLVPIPLVPSVFPFQSPSQLSSAQLSRGCLLPFSQCTFLTLWAINPQPA